MKQSLILRAFELFPGSDTVRKYSFKTVQIGDNYAPLARANHLLSQDFALSVSESAHFEDCFECLSPHRTAA